MTKRTQLNLAGQQNGSSGFAHDGEISAPCGIVFFFRALMTSVTMIFIILKTFTLSF